MRFHDLYDEQASLTPGAPAVVSCRRPLENVTLSYTELQARSRGLAAALQARSGDEPGIAAVWLPRSHKDFLPVLLALSRCNICFALMSTDLKDEDLQRQRNQHILKFLNPGLLIVSDEGVPDAAVEVDCSCMILEVTPQGSLRGERTPVTPATQAVSQSTRSMPPGAVGALCLLFTGGTFRSRCVAITHAMVEHERQTYSECLEVKFALRIAAHTSVYWGASALGQLSIALAFGGCAVLCEVSDTDDFRRTIIDESVNTIGLVPDQLKLLADDPCVELPDMEVVFIWGEKLPVNVAQRWSNHPKARLRELLVSTEYWLSFYSAPLEGLGRHKIVRGVDTLIVDQSGQPVEDGTGELLIHGPMVTTGFIATQESDAPSSFTEVHGKVYFRTRDLVQRWPDGTLEFRGRADMTMKQRGQWVDLVSVENKLQQIHAVEEVAVLPDPAGSSMLHAFIVLKKPSGGEIGSDIIADVFREVRCSLPQGRIHTLCSLPRHHVTRKVDVRKLTALTKGHEESWPLNPASQPTELIANRAKDKVKELCSWTSLAVLTALLWDFRSLASFKRPSGLGILVLPYMHLGFLHMVDEQGALGKFATALSEMSPMGIWGVMLLSFLNHGVVSWWCDRTGPSHLRTSLRFASMATHFLATAWTMYGVTQGIRRGRLFSFPIVFWSGIGHRLQYDLERWCTLRYWKRHLSWLLSLLFPEGNEKNERQQVETAETNETTATEPTQESPESSSEIEPRCSWCCRRMVSTWPPPLITEKYAILQSPVTVYGCNDRMGDPICWSCWVPASKAAGEECSLLATQLLKDDSVEKDETEENQEEDAQDTQEAWSMEEKSQYDRWWWKNKTVDYVKLTQSAQEPSLGATPALAELKDPTQRKIYQIVQDVLRTEVTDNMSFHGLDSLMLGLLLGRLRAEFGVSLSISQVRNSSPQQLPQLLEQGQRMQAPNEKNINSNCEYAVWFSPGQYFPMGGWVLRKDGEICPHKMEQAAYQVVMRHDALRAVPADPLRMLSFVLDTAVMFTLACRLLDRSPLTRWIRQAISWALKNSWARIVVKAPESIYGSGDFPSPLVHICVTDQQAAEYHAKERRKMLASSGNPIDIALIQLHVRLEGLWVYGVNGGMGDFVILEAPEGSQLILVDRNRKEAARLCGPTDSGWIPPPYGFPALLSGRLHPEAAEDGAGGVIWLRLKASNHLAILWRARASAKPRRYEAFHMPGDDLRHRVFNYLVVHAMHIIADGQSYEAIVGDLLALYSADSNSQAPPILANSLEVLQKRLFDALDATDPRNSPQLCSLRGSQWRCSKKGYNHILGFVKSVLSSLRLAAFKHSVPFDAALLALTAIAVANATAVEELEFTLYVPLRDGVGEAGLCGLFADWRALSIEVDRETATVLGVVQQVGHKIRTRQWSVYNALKKPEATMVNFQLLDSAEPSSRAGFGQIGEELWRIGECMKDEMRNNDPLQAIPQPLSFVIEQGDKETWWLLINCCYDEYPPPILRRMLRAFQEAAEALVNKPTAKAHVSFPDNFY